MDTITVKQDISLYERILEGNFYSPFNKEDENSKKIYLDSFVGRNFWEIEKNTFGKWEYRLIPVPDGGINLYDARKLCESDDWEVAKNEHLLALSTEFPDEQRKFPIIQLGSSANFADEFGGPVYFTCIGEKSGKRIYAHVSYNVGCNTDFIHEKSDSWIPPLHLLSVRKIA